MIPEAEVIPDAKPKPPLARVVVLVVNTNPLEPPVEPDMVPWNEPEPEPDADACGKKPYITPLTILPLKLAPLTVTFKVPDAEAVELGQDGRYKAVGFAVVEFKI